MKLSPSILCLLPVLASATTSDLPSLAEGFPSQNLTTRANPPVPEKGATFRPDDLSVAGQTVDWSHTVQPPEPPRNGLIKGAVTCNPNGHTCNKQKLTPEICALQCTCDDASGFITCNWWSECRKETVEWNCQCHSTNVPPLGKCKGFIGFDGAAEAAKTGKWPMIAPNKVDAHPTRIEVSSFRRRGLGMGSWGLW